MIVSQLHSILTPFVRRRPRHIWLIRVSNSNLDRAAASYSLSRRIDSTTAAAAAAGARLL